MAPIDFEGRTRPVLIAAGVLMLGGIVLFLRLWMAPPQIGPDEDVFKTVDALFTAINSHDQQRLQDCRHRLQAYHRDGKLPSAAAKRLDAIIKQADSGQWRESARVLYDFMLIQRGT